MTYTSRLSSPLNVIQRPYVIWHGVLHTVNKLKYNNNVIVPSLTSKYWVPAALNSHKGLEKQSTTGQMFSFYMVIRFCHAFTRQVLLSPLSPRKPFATRARIPRRSTYFPSVALHLTRRLGTTITQDCWLSVEFASFSLFFCLI